MTSAGVSVEFVKEQLVFRLGTSDLCAEFQMHILGAVAQLEQSIIRERVPANQPPHETPA